MMNILLRIFIVFFFLLYYVKCKTTNVNYMQPYSSAHFSPEKTSLGFNKQNFNIFCYAGKQKFLAHIFQTITLELVCDGDDYTQYQGATPDEVKTDYENHKSLFSFNFMSYQKKILYLDPFNQSCIGIESNVEYEVKLNLIQIDLWRVILLSAGILLFFAAAKLTQNVLFYYTCGVLLGIFASFLIIVYLFSKLIPKKPMMYGVMVGGWTLGIYFVQLIFENLQTIFITYRDYVMWYILITGFISFIICYRLGTPTNKKSKNLIQWSLQFIALIAIFFSSNYREATMAINVGMVLLYYCPKNWLSKTSTFWKRKFPTKRKLITMDEYHEQGVIETAKALEELKKYCSSPECKQWRTIMRLKEPSRFASFIEGESHVMDEEIFDHEASLAAEVSEDEEDALNLTDTDNELDVQEVQDVKRRSFLNLNSSTPRVVRATGRSLTLNNTSTPKANRRLPTANGSHSVSASRYLSNNSRGRQNIPNNFDMSEDED